MQIKNLEKIKTLTQRIIPALKVGHSEAIAQELLQIPLPQQYETSVLESLDEPHKFNMDQDKVRLGQGQLQDREFLNALALVVGSKFFENFTFYEEQEKVVFRFYKKQQLYSVIVDFQIPLSGHLPLYAQTYNNNIYCSLIEKAYAALQGSYQDLNGVSLRDSIRDLTGLDPDIVIYPSPESINLKLLNLNDSVVGFIYYTHIEFTFKKQSFVPVPNRMYFVKSIDQNKYLIKDYFEDQEYEILDPQTAFNCCVIIKDFPDEYRGMGIEVNTTNGGVPAPGNQQWLTNPSFQFQVGVGVQQQESPFVFRLSELEQQDGITGLLLLNQRDVRTFSQNNVVYMTKPNIIQLGGRKQNYSVTFQTLSKGYYTLFIFSTSKAASRVLLEIFYSGRPSTLEFKFKFNSILEYCTSEDDQLRLFKDQTKTVPGSFRQLMILNQAALAQKPYIDNPKLDSEQEFLVENQLQEELLGVGLEGQEPTETDIYDFSYYMLDDEAFQLLLPELIAEDRIRELRLKGNKLSDDSILKLCYELEKSYHTELELLDVSDNSITKQGIETLQQFKKRFKIEIIK